MLLNDFYTFYLIRYIEIMFLMDFIKMICKFKFFFGAATVPSISAL
jgi:hypothetical protein